MRLIPRQCVLLLAAAAPLRLLAQVPSRPFAAPDVAASLPATSASGVGQVTLALLLVLGAVFVAAYVMRRLRNMTGRGAQGIEVLSQISLGARERAVIVKVGTTRLLLGVAPGRVSTLHVLPSDLELPTAVVAASSVERPTFASLLKKSLGR